MARGIKSICVSMIIRLYGLMPTIRMRPVSSRIAFPLVSLCVCISSCYTRGVCVFLPTISRHCARFTHARTHARIHARTHTHTHTHTHKHTHTRLYSLFPCTNMQTAGTLCARITHNAFTYTTRWMARRRPAAGTLPPLTQLLLLLHLSCISLVQLITGN